MGFHSVTAAANLALALSILALTLSSLRHRLRPAHGRSWLFFAAASVTLVLKSVLEALDYNTDLGAVFEVATAALLGGGFVFLYGADSDELRRLQT